MLLPCPKQRSFAQTEVHLPFPFIKNQPLHEPAGVTEYINRKWLERDLHAPIADLERVRVASFR